MFVQSASSFINPCCALRSAEIPPAKAKNDASKTPAFAHTPPLFLTFREMEDIHTFSFRVIQNHP